MTKKKLTAHEKKVELAKAAAPQYGIYIDGGSVDKIIEAAEVIGPIVLEVLASDSDEKTKQSAIGLLKDAIPTVNYCTISDVSVNMGK